MALNPKYAPAQGDSLWSLTRKLLQGFYDGVFSTGGGGGGSGGAVTVADGTASGAAAVATTNTLLTAVPGMVVRLAPSSSITGAVGGFTNVVVDHSVVTAASYSAGNAVGGKRTLANALGATSGTGILESITILDRANQKQPMTIFLFSDNPAAATITDHAAFQFSTDDLKVIAQITVAASDYVTTNSEAIACKSGLGVALKSVSQTVYAAVVTSGTPTFAATTDFQVTWGFLADA